MAKDALRQAVKTDFDPFLRAAGFVGTFPVWRLQREGDIAVVEVSADKYNEGTFGQFYLNVAVVPPAWWAWTHECAADHPRGSTSREGRARDWDGLYRALLAPPGPGLGEAWEVDSLARATEVSAGMTHVMRARGLPSMMEVMGPGRMLAALRAGRIDERTPVGDRPGMRELVEAVLLTEVGGAELEHACARLDALANEPYARVFAATAAWARRRGAAAL